MVNPLELINSIKTASDNINKNTKLAIPLLAGKAHKSANERPNDQTLRLLANVLGKMSENGKLFITRGEFKDLYSKFSSRGTKAIEVFANELDIVDVDPQRDIAGKEIGSFDVYECADNQISNALSSFWDDNGKPAKYGTLSSHDPKLSKQAETLTSLELARTGYSPKAVTTVGGSEEHIICDALYETPKGEAHILVPVEISKSGTMIPSTIVSKIGMLSLNKNTVKQSILGSAGQNLVVDTNVLLKSLSAMNSLKEYSEFEIQALTAQEAVNKGSLSKEASDNKNTLHVDGPATVGFFDVYTEEGGAIKTAESEDMKTFASYLNNGNGIAEFSFGKDIVDGGRNVVISKMASFGYKPQVSVSSTCDDSIIYAVGCDTRNGPIGFEVVVEVKNNKPMIPSVLAVKDSVFEFSKEGIDKVITSQLSDSKMVATVSPYYGLKPSELIETIRVAADKNNYRVAEDALVVLSETSGPEMYSKGLTEYMRSLDGSLNKTASEKCGCNKVVNSPTHQEPMCGHLHLPLSKVAQDESGRCIPKYREAMKDTYEGILFNTSKVFL